MTGAPLFVIVVDRPTGCWPVVVGQLDHAPDDEAERDGGEDPGGGADQLAGPLGRIAGAGGRSDAERRGRWATAALLAVIMDRAAKTASFFENITKFPLG